MAYGRVKEGEHDKKRIFYRIRNLFQSAYFSGFNKISKTAGRQTRSSMSSGFTFTVIVLYNIIKNRKSTIILEGAIPWQMISLIQLRTNE